MAEKRVIDWEAVERVYRAGVLSLREIGKIHEVSEGMIRKKAKASGWERDLTERVNEKVRNELVRNPVRTANPQTEREIVDDAAAQIVHVVRSHRAAIGKGKALAEIMMDQLQEAVKYRDDIEEEIEELTAADKTGERRAKMLRAVSLPTHASTLVNLANAQKTWIGLDRQSFGLADGDSGKAPDTPAERLNMTAEDAYLKMIQGR